MFYKLSQLGSGLDAVGAAMDTMSLQRELGVSVIEVQMKVGFVRFTKHNSACSGS